MGWPSYPTRSKRRLAPYRGMKNIIAKLGTMRKAKSFTVYPPTSDGRIIIQTSDRICSFMPDGVGVLSAASKSGAYFHHLSPALGATGIVVPPDVVAAALAAQPQRGDVIGPGVVVG